MNRFEATPIYRLSEKLNKNAFYIKRDDLLPFSFGGNKARKAILFFEDLDSKCCDCVVTYGSSSSNHCRIIANMAVARNKPCYIVSPIEKSKPTANSKMIELFGAKVIHCTVVEVVNTINKTIDELRKEGKQPYFIKGGGHGNIGTQAFVDAYDEIVIYEKVNEVHFDYIFLTSGTGTTQAGLVCGKILHGDIREIVGISNARENPRGQKGVLASVNEYLGNLGIENVTADEITFIDDYVLDGYGSYNEEILKTIQEFLAVEGVPLDSTYTGKAYYGMKEYIKKNQIVGKNILFIHTGGTPLFFDMPEEFWKYR